MSEEQPVQQHGEPEGSRRVILPDDLAKKVWAIVHLGEAIRQHFKEPPAPQGAEKDNPYIIPPLEPDEFDDVLGVYEDYVIKTGETMTARQKALAARVLGKLHEADAMHICIDEGE